jgi:hypothetical protein
MQVRDVRSKCAESDLHDLYANNEDHPFVGLFSLVHSSIAPLSGYVQFSA